MNPREDDPDLARRRPTLDDLRDDYDDEFGRSRSPLAIARRRLFVLGVVHIAFGIVAGIWTLLMVAALVAECLDGDGDTEDFVLVAAALLAALILVVVVIAGGGAMIHRRRRRLAMSAAFVMAALSVPLFLFGVWALLLLNRPDVRREFARLPVKSQHDH